MPPVGFKPTIPASARPQTYALDRAATGIGELNKTCLILYSVLYHCYIWHISSLPSLGQIAVWIKWRIIYHLLRPLACWDCGFESRRGHGCLSLVIVKCCLLRRADHSSRGVLRSFVYLKRVCSRSPLRGGHDPNTGRSVTGK
jgi:hypothetical protein